MTLEQQARVGIDALLVAAGWQVCHLADVNPNADSGLPHGVAIREFPLLPGHGFADYLFYVKGKACGVIKAKNKGPILQVRMPLPSIAQQVRIVAEVDNHLQRAQALRLSVLFKAFHAP